MHNGILRTAAIVSVAITTPVLFAASPVGFEKLTLSDQYLSDGIDAADFDGDGHLDVVAGQWWWRGPDFGKRYEFTEPEKLVREKEQAGNKLTYVHDFNGDGKTDILLIGRVHIHPAYWFENPSRDVPQATRWKKHHVFERIKGESPPFIDLTGDGRPEIVTHDEKQWGHVSPDRSDPTKPWTFHAIPNTQKVWPQFYHGTGVGDVNGDGRMDLLLNDGWWERPGDLLQTWRHHAHQFGTKGGAQMYSYDVDADGDADIISSLDAHGWGLAWFEQIKRDGAMTFEKHVIMGERSEEAKYGVAFTQPHALALADFDGDGLADIITGKRYWAHGPTGDIEPSEKPVLYWFRLVRENGTARYIPHLIDEASGVGTQLRIVDLNNDGRPDVLTTGRVGTFVFFNRGPAN